MNCNAEHGLVVQFWHFVEALSADEQRSFLQFVCGRSRLPSLTVTDMQDSDETMRLRLQLWVGADQGLILGPRA